MGNDNSIGITIHVDRNNSFYYSGETITGIVKLNTTEENLETRQIYISLTGEIVYEIIRSTGGVIHVSQSECHDIQFYYKKVNLSGHNMTQQEFIYNRGEHLLPFRIPLIDKLPPTINQPDVFPRVRYYLEVVIDKLWYKSNIRRRKYLTIHPHVNLLQNPQCLSPSVFECENRKDIILMAIFNKLGYVEGENIQFTLEIQNPRKVLIQHANLKMLKCYQIIERKPNESIVYKTMLPKIKNLTNEQIIETFVIKIPSIQLPPSYEFQGENVNAFVRIYYMLKLSVKVQGIFSNCHIYIPITLGTEPNSDLNQRQTFNPLNVSNLSNAQQSILDGDDSPPDYETAIQNLQPNFL